MSWLEFVVFEKKYPKDIISSRFPWIPYTPGNYDRVMWKARILRREVPFFYVVFLRAVNLVRDHGAEIVGAAIKTNINQIVWFNF